jgi:hypothetical protein
MILSKGAMMINNRTDTSIDFRGVGYEVGSVDGVAKRVGGHPLRGAAIDDQDGALKRAP